MKFNFQIEHQDKKTQARRGVIQTGHGQIETPAFVPVGTQATVKSLSGEDLQAVGTQVFFVNTYHLYLRPGLSVIKKFGGVHQFINWKKPLMSDSAGFQIFSLARPHRPRKLKIGGTEIETPLVKINEEGVVFRSHLDGSEHIFTPEKSIESQIILGTDIMIAFDECTFYPATYEYTKAAMERTHRWALRSFQYALNNKRDYQALYGVVQGGIFEDLRKMSAQFISSLDFSGVAIGGVSVGESKKEMEDVLNWVLPLLPLQKPRHLLGVGEIDDIFVLVEKGVDSFDCVMPTRLARMGVALIRKQESKIQDFKQKFYLDINKAVYAEDGRPLDEQCNCWVCQNYKRAYIHHLFRANELLSYRLLTYHNLWFIESLMREIRKAIINDSFSQLKAEWLG